MTEAADVGSERPAPSHLRLVVLVLEGYIYLALILSIFLAATGFLLWGVLTRRPFIAITAILVGGPVAATTARALRALWFVFPQPEGIEVGQHVGRPLGREVEEIARRVSAPRIHRILVTDAANASAVQLPRAGVFWPTNTLLLGYPLLAALSVDQIRAVIAHEVGHMTHAHGRFESWVHRTRLSWMQLVELPVPPLVYRLFRFYVPRLYNQAGAVSRQQELLADRLAAGVTGPEVAAEALVAIQLLGFLLEETFWPRIGERVEHDSDPPGPFSEMGPEIWGVSADNREQLLDRVLADDTAASHTHPALGERLAAIGQPPRWPRTVDTTAADYFFGSQKEELAAMLDHEWQAAHGRKWRARHDEIRGRRERLRQLAALTSPTPELTFERGLLMEREGDANAALDFYLSAHREGHAAGGLAAGRLLLDRGDAAGIALIDAAIDSDAALVEDGCGAVIDFLERLGRNADAHHYRVRMTRHAVASKMARDERAELSVVDRLRPCAHAGIDVTGLSRQLASEPAVARAFLATKELRYSRGTQTVLAVLVANGAASGLRERLRCDSVLPDDVTVVVLGRDDQPIEAALSEVSGALIYNRSR